jgi:hypothetical protein
MRFVFPYVCEDAPGVYSIGAPSPFWISCFASRKTGVVGENLIKEVCSLRIGIGAVVAYAHCAL